MQNSSDNLNIVSFWNVKKNGILEVVIAWANEKNIWNIQFQIILNMK